MTKSEAFQKAKQDAAEKKVCIGVWNIGLGQYTIEPYERGDKKRDYYAATVWPDGIMEPVNEERR